MTAWRCRSTIPRQKGETDLADQGGRCSAGRRYVVCRNEEEARKDAETRTALLAGLERKLAQGDKALVGNAGYRRFLADSSGRWLYHRSRQGGGRRAVRWGVCACAPTSS